MVPIVRYAFEPVIANAALHLEEIICRRGDEAGEQISHFEQAVSHGIAEVAARSTAHANSAARERARSSQSLLRQEIADLRARIALELPDNPCVHGLKVYAQTDEDGIIENILSRLPGHSRTFIEIGCGNGLENNTHYLALKGYRGCWIDGSEDNIAFIKNGLGGLEFRNLLVGKSFVATENIGALVADLCGFIKTTEPGFFSLDVDGNDLHILAEALKGFRPLTICVEYNAKFPPPMQIAMQYDPNHRWAGDDYHGASLQSLCDELVDYKLVACNLTGVNAFFVRRERAGAFSDYTPEQLYQPFRENLIDLWAEHQPSLKWLKDKLSLEE